MRSTIAGILVVVLILLTGCQSTVDADASVGAVDAGGVVPSPDGMGFCCPIAPPTCDCFPAGGFAMTGEGCEGRRLCDAAPPGMIIVDEHGCQVFVSSASCLVPPDAGGP